MPIAHRGEGWLEAGFHAAFREMTLHAAAREGLLCPAYCLMPELGYYWRWFWKHYFSVREPGLEKRQLPPREME
jgi:hypothetical protein